jgi:hypothetical protein
MGGVGLHDDRAARGEGGDGVAARHRERQREVGCAEDGDGPQGDEHSAQVGAGERLAVGKGAVDAGVHPGAVLHEVGEEARLVGGAPALPGEAGAGQRGLGLRPFEEGVAEGLEVIGDRPQEDRPPGRRHRRTSVEGLAGRSRGGVDLRRSRLGELRIEGGPGPGVLCAKRDLPLA